MSNMIRLLLFCIMVNFAHHALHLLLLAHVCSYTLDHAEPKLEEPTE
jgi:hypothetical protein